MSFPPIGPLYPATVLNGSGTGNRWVNPQNAALADGVYTTIIQPNYRPLIGTGFSANVPATAIVVGVEARVMRHWLGGIQPASDAGAFLYLNGGIVGVNQAQNTNIPSSDGEIVFGSPTNDWSAGLVASDYNNSQFGFGYSAFVNGGTSTIYVDYMNLTIYYRFPSASSSGGILIGGTAIPFAAFIGAAAGGLLLGGAPGGTPNYNGPPAGGFVLGGNPGGMPSYRSSPSGGPLFGGSASPSASILVSSSGGPLIGGTAAATPAFMAAPRGGLLLGGTTPTVVGAYLGSPSGGLVLGGATPSIQQIAATSSGGMIFGNHSLPSSVFVAQPSGGIVLGGTGLAGSGMTLAATSSGGLLLGGATISTAQIAAGSAGGLLIGGTSAASVDQIAANAGGLVFGGATVGSYPTASTAGGFVVGGSASPLGSTIAASAGGILFGGSARASTVVISQPSGGFLLGGHTTAYTGVSKLLYNVYRGSSTGGPIDYTTPLGTTGNTVYTVSDATTPSSTWYGVRAYDPQLGFEEKNTDAQVLVVIGPDGSDQANLPFAPQALRVLAGINGTADVEWAYPYLVKMRKPKGFNIYIGPPGFPNYAAPASVVAYLGTATGTVHFRGKLLGLLQGATYSISVRAYNAAGEEKNTVMAALVGMGQPPDGVEDLTAALTY